MIIRDFIWLSSCMHIFAQNTQDETLNEIFGQSTELNGFQSDSCSKAIQSYSKAIELSDKAMTRIGQLLDYCQEDKKKDKIIHNTAFDSLTRQHELEILQRDKKILNLEDQLAEAIANNGRLATAVTTVQKQIDGMDNSVKQIASSTKKMGCNTKDQPTLVLKTNGDPLLWYGSPYWENSELLNEYEPADAIGNAKYLNFMNTPFNNIKMCVHEAKKNCVTYTFTSAPENANHSWSSAHQLFNAGYQRATDLDQTGIEKAFGLVDGTYQRCGMQRPGFNTQCKHGNWARIGYCNNCANQKCQVSDSHDSDAAIGIGLQGQLRGNGGTYTQGAGWTRFFAPGAGKCEPPTNVSTTARAGTAVWLYVY